MNTITTDSQSRPMQWKWPIFGVCIGLLLGGYLIMPEYAQAADASGYMLRVTARIAFAFLLLAYVARPLVQLFGVGRGLVRHRRYLGLSMAIAHTVHFYYVAELIIVHDMPVEPITYIFGGLAFVLMWLMAATSNDAAMRTLGRNWKRLHTFGLHYLWIIFMQSFVPRAFMPELNWLYLLISVAGFAALGLRIWAYTRRAR